MAARTHPTLAAIAAELHVGLRDISGRLLRRLDVDDPVATEHLAAVLDGLALNAALHPDRLDPDTVRAVLRHHVAQLPGTRRDGGADAPRTGGRT